MPAPGGRGRGGRDPADGGAANTPNDDRNDTTSALPRRSEENSVRLNCEADLTLSWLIFRKWDRGLIAVGKAHQALERITTAPWPPPAPPRRGRRPGRCARSLPPGRPARSEPSCE